MVKIPNSIKLLLDNYIVALKENGIDIKSVYLFGSFAKGNFTKNSDIDIAIVSDSFEGVRFLDKNKIRKITLSISEDLEVIPFSPNDFTIDNPLVKEIVNTGFQIA